jgi:transcriptional regulator with XRE-family HTH domain
MLDDIYEIADSAMVKELGERYQTYRLRYNKTQKEVAEQAGISIFTISAFEKGNKAGISLLIFIKLLRAINELGQVAQLLPELPVSPRLLYEQAQKQRKRATKQNRS